MTTEEKEEIVMFGIHLCANLAKVFQFSWRIAEWERLHISMAFKFK